MTDTDKLKRLAELLRFGDTSGEYSKAILALIAENERLRALASLGNKAILREGLDADRYQRQRDEAVALLREWDRVGIDATGGGNLDDNTEAFLARIDAETQEK